MAYLSIPGKKSSQRDLDLFRSGLSSLFDSFFEESTAWEGTQWNPPMDIKRNENMVTLSVDLPGLTEDEIHIQTEKGYLTISGQRNEKKEVKEEEVVVSQRVYGSFKRSVKLPQGADVDSIKAGYTNGVLEISVPVVRQKDHNKIDIRVQ